MIANNLKNFWAEGFFPTVHTNPKNKTVYWHGIDTEENFLANPKPGYTKTSITYTFNSYGFRCDEFDLSDTRPKILCIGCSHTEGVGLNSEDVWVAKIQQEYPTYKVYNLGMGGCSSDSIARVLTNVSSLLTPEKVFILWPSMSRFETLQFPDAVHYHGTWNLTPEKLFMYDDLQQYNNFQKDRIIVQLLQNKYKFKLYELEFDKIVEYDAKFSHIVDQARDDHFGPKHHEHMANLFLNLVE